MLTAAACAMRTKAYLKIANNCRRLSQMHQFRTEPYFIMLACIGGGGIPAFAAWQDLRLQKFLHRELMIYDAVVKGYKFHFSTSNGRWAQEIKSGLTSRLGDAVPVDDEHPDAEAEDEPTGGVRGQSGVAWRRGTRIPLGDAMDDEDPMDVDGENDDATADVDADAGADIDDDADMAEEDEGRDEVDMGLGEVPVKPTKFSPMWNYLYGISMLNSKSYQTALCEWCSLSAAPGTCSCTHPSSLLATRIRARPIPSPAMLVYSPRVPWPVDESASGRPELLHRTCTYPPSLCIFI